MKSIKKSMHWYVLAESRAFYALSNLSAPFGYAEKAVAFFSTLTRGGKALSRLLVALIGPYVKAEGYLQEGEKAPPHHR